MAKKQRARTSEPRPVCPECSHVVDPQRAVPYGTAKILALRVLEGIYCGSDCILNAVKRGYPKGRCE